MDFCLGGDGKCRGGAFSANDSVANAKDFPEIRLGTGNRWSPSYNPTDPDDRALRGFSAVCYLTALKLSKMFAVAPPALAGPSPLQWARVWLCCLRAGRLGVLLPARALLPLTVPPRRHFARISTHTPTGIWAPTCQWASLSRRTAALAWRHGPR